jgi:ribosomal-protein-alanine N-acetyltransferase
MSDEVTEIPQFSFRPATEEDLPLILAIEKMAYPLPWKEEAFRAEFTKDYSEFLVLTDDETDSKLVGYIVYWLQGDECHVLNVTVDLNWRGLGLAMRLMRRAIDDAIHKDMQRVFLEVRKSNTAAIALYQKMGFFIDHAKKNFYDNGDDAYFMTLLLNKPNKF